MVRPVQTRILQLRRDGLPWTTEIRKAVDGSFAELYHDLDGGFKPINLLLPGLPLPMNIKRDKAQKKMSDFYVNIIEKRREKGAAVSVSSALVPQ